MASQEAEQASSAPTASETSSMALQAEMQVDGSVLEGGGQVSEVSVVLSVRAKHLVANLSDDIVL
jgi:hypothetical protein